MMNEFLERFRQKDINTTSKVKSNHLVIIFVDLWLVEISILIVTKLIGIYGFDSNRRNSTE